VSSTFSTRSKKHLLVGACALTAAGCAGRLPQLTLSGVDELTDVPFFPQTEYDCGPAALATILGAAGAAVTPTELIDAVYIEGLKGSLQVELLAATRRHDRLPIPVPTDAQGLLAEVASGRPVLVLQNLALERVPAWHYAVVVGFDASAERVVLRSGQERRRLERTQRFLRSWRLADHWGFVAAKPGEIPTTATPDGYMRALLDAEKVLAAASTDAAYDAAIARWPSDPLVSFLTGARKHSAGDLPAAADLYRRALASEPSHAAARNNLANVLFEQGCRTEALREARAALESVPPDGDFHVAITDTVRQIESSPATAAEPAVCTPG
jgi:tetratricopeptide (TPR) repeat protein